MMRPWTPPLGVLDLGSGGGRGELSRHYSNGSVSSPGFAPTFVVPPGAEEGTRVVDAAIQERLRAIEPPESERRFLGELKSGVQSSLAGELDVERVSVVGSYSKRTQIRREAGNDIDLELVLRQSTHGEWLTQENGPRNCLNKVRSIIERDPRFTNVDVSVDRNVVTARFGQSTVDIAPAFVHPDGGVVIPDTFGGQTWIRANPRLSNRLLHIMDARHRQGVIPVVKLVKDWDARHGGHLGSHLIEAMAMRHFAEKPDGGERSLRTDTHEFLSRFVWYLQKGATRDPVYGTPADDHLTPELRSTVISRAIRAAGKLDKAEALIRAGKFARGADLYREVLGG
jgi:hypothetical protein